MDATDVARFWSKVVRSEDGCWGWLGSLKPDGYPRFKMDGKMVLARQIMWSLTQGSDPGDARIVSTCGNRVCVRPDHLTLSSNADLRVQRFWDKVKIGAPDACWPWQGAIMHDGYGNIKWSDGFRKAHRVAYELRYGPIPDGMMVCHRCDNRACVNPAHLFLGTNSDNLQDMGRKHRSKWDAHPEMTKITRKQAREIRQAYATGSKTIESIEAEYGLSKSHVYAILGNQKWKD